MGNCIHLEFDVSGTNFATAGTASEEVKRKLKQLGVNANDVRRVAISMYEGEINMVIHAGGGKAIVDIDTEKIIVRLEDHGKGIPDIELALQPGYSTAPEDVHNMGFGAGMGLPNMKKYSDNLDIWSKVGEGTIVTLTTYFKNN